MQHTLTTFTDKTYITAAAHAAVTTRKPNKRADIVHGIELNRAEL